MTNYQAVPGNNHLWRVVDHDNDLIVAWRCAQEDARLFAAAPEMLEALKVATTDDWDPMLISADDIRSIMLAAIAKAEQKVISKDGDND